MLTSALGLLASFWRPIAALFGGALMYLKGRSDTKKAQRLADAEHNLEVRRNVDEALRRLDGDISTARGRLRNRRIDPR